MPHRFLHAALETTKAKHMYSLRDSPVFERRVNLRPIEKYENSEIQRDAPVVGSRRTVVFFSQ
jgi:hypothetical protein